MNRVWCRGSQTGSDRLHYASDDAALTAEHSTALSLDILLLSDWTQKDSSSTVQGAPEHSWMLSPCAAFKSGRSAAQDWHYVLYAFLSLSIKRTRSACPALRINAYHRYLTSFSGSQRLSCICLCCNRSSSSPCRNGSSGGKTTPLAMWPSQRPILMVSPLLTSFSLSRTAALILASKL